ncbi:MAG: DUF2752 domain-containing protein [Bacteroidota bacterium]
MEPVTNLITSNADSWMLSCPSKSLFGVDCPGCGFQRAFADLLQGDFAGCWEHYPPLLPFLITILLLGVALWTRWRYRLPALVTAFATTCLFILVNYSAKML